MAIFYTINLSRTPFGVIGHLKTEKNSSINESFPQLNGWFDLDDKKEYRFLLITMEINQEDKNHLTYYVL